jgi:hypothetical protein
MTMRIDANKPLPLESWMTLYTMLGADKVRAVISDLVENRPPAGIALSRRVPEGLVHEAYRLWWGVARGAVLEHDLNRKGAPDAC